MDIRKIKKLIELLEHSSLTEMEITEGEETVKLSRMGHSVRILGAMDLFFGGVQMTAIWPATGEMVGSADPRRGGSAETRIIEAKMEGAPLKSGN